MPIVTVGNVVDGSSRSLVLPCEFFYGDWTEYYREKELSSLRTGGTPLREPDFEERSISLRNLALFRLNPIASPENTNLGPDVLKECLSELIATSFKFNFEPPPTLAILLPDKDLSTIEGLMACWKHYKDQVNLVISSPVMPTDTPHSIQSTIEVGIKTLTHGYVRCGIIGPVFVSGNITCADIHTLQIALKVAANYQPKTAPIVVIGDLTATCLNRCISEANLDDFGHNFRILVIGEFISAGSQECATQRTPYTIYSAPIMSEYRNDIAVVTSPDTWKRTVVKHRAKLLTSGLSFKIDFRSWGGEGPMIRLTRLVGTDMADQIKEMNKNACEYLAFDWHGPMEETYEGERFVEPCTWCKNTVSDEENSLKKFDFIYCSSKCLISHKRADWKSPK